jgi:hypothetical protein
VTSSGGGPLLGSPSLRHASTARSSARWVSVNRAASAAGSRGIAESGAGGASGTPAGRVLPLSSPPQPARASNPTTRTAAAVRRARRLALGFRRQCPPHPALVCLRGERAGWPPSTARALRAGPWARPGPGKNGGPGGASQRPPRPPRLLPVGRRLRACAHALHLAPFSRRASSADPQTHSSACRTSRTTSRGRPEALLELPPSASEPRSARAGRGAPGMHRCRVAPTTESDQWSCEQNGRVAASPPPAALVSSVPRVPP